MAQQPGGGAGSPERTYTSAEVAHLRRELQNRNQALAEQEAVMAAILQQSTRQPSGTAAAPSAPMTPNRDHSSGAAAQLPYGIPVAAPSTGAAADHQPGLLSRITGGALFGPNTTTTTAAAPHHTSTLNGSGSSGDSSSSGVGGRAASISSLPDQPLIVPHASGAAGGGGARGHPSAPMPGASFKAAVAGAGLDANAATDEELARALQADENSRAASAAAARSYAGAQQKQPGGFAKGRPPPQWHDHEALPVAAYASAGSNGSMVVGGQAGGSSRVPPGPQAWGRTGSVGGGMTDEQYAHSLQQQEMYIAAQYVGQADGQDDTAMVDPVWGRYEGRPGEGEGHPDKYIVESANQLLIGGLRRFI